MIIVFVKSIDMKYRDINLLYAMNFMKNITIIIITIMA
jgi:hypothetical protein